MANLLNVYSRQGWRVTLVFDVLASGVALQPAIATFARTDGFPTDVAVKNSFLSPDDGYALELALTTPLLDGVTYVVSPAGAFAPWTLNYHQPIAAQITTSNIDDPEAEAFGVDADWFAPTLDGTGDLPEMRGRQCLTNDIQTMWLVVPGELTHRPDDGAAVTRRVNGPGNSGGLSELQSTMKRQATKDPRVSRGGVTVKAAIDSLGNVIASALIQPVALPEPLTVKIPSPGG